MPGVKNPYAVYHKPNSMGFRTKVDGFHDNLRHMNNPQYTKVGGRLVSQRRWVRGPRRLSGGLLKASCRPNRVKGCDTTERAAPSMLGAVAPSHATVRRAHLACVALPRLASALGTEAIATLPSECVRINTGPKAPPMQTQSAPICRILQTQQCQRIRGVTTSKKTDNPGLRNTPSAHMPHPADPSGS